MDGDAAHIEPAAAIKSRWLLDEDEGLPSSNGQVSLAIFFHSATRIRLTPEGLRNSHINLDQLSLLWLVDPLALLDSKLGQKGR